MNAALPCSTPIFRTRLVLSCYHQIPTIPIPPIPGRLFGETHSKNRSQTNIDHQIHLFRKSKTDRKGHFLYHHVSSWCFSPCSCCSWEICQPLGLHQPQGISLHSGHGWKSRLCYVACMHLCNRLLKGVSAAQIRLLTWAAWKGHSIDVGTSWWWRGLDKFQLLQNPFITWKTFKASNLLLTTVKMNF